MSLTEAVMAVANEQGVSDIPGEKSGVAENKGEGLGDLIRRLREEKELTNEVLAEAAGISMLTLGGILAGTTACPDCISPNRLGKLASALGTTLSALAQAAEDDGCTCYGSGGVEIPAEDDADANQDEKGAKDSADEADETPDDVTIAKQVDALLSGFPGLPPDEDPGVHAYNRFNLDFLTVEEPSHA